MGFSRQTLEWVVMLSSTGPRDGTKDSPLQADSLPSKTPSKSLTSLILYYLKQNFSRDNKKYIKIKKKKNTATLSNFRSSLKLLLIGGIVRNSRRNGL